MHNGVARNKNHIYVNLFGRSFEIVQNIQGVRAGVYRKKENKKILFLISIHN